VPIVHNRPALVEPPLTLDPLDAALAGLHPRGAFYVRSDLGAPWGFSAEPGLASFHFVESGRCVLSAEGAGDVELAAGDLAVLPHGPALAFRDAPGTPAPPLDALLSRQPEPGRGLDGAGDGPRTALVCGGVAFDDAVPHPVLDALPPVLVLRRAVQDEAPWLAHTLRFLACEARSGRPGAATVMGHLGSVLFVQAVRAALGGAGAPGWLGALADPHVGPALRAIHRVPEAPWTVEALGREGGLGRSAFAARFRAAVGEAPMRHVARWRIYHAARHLRTGATLAEAAGRVGYESEAAFGRAFKRWTGRSPGALRRAA
jgi:AraC-like DNA-binding protein